MAERPAMKFIADVMLGKLAKRLRLLGFDVVYDRTLDDNEIIRISLEQKRLILTRDTALALRPLARDHLLVRSELPDAQVEEVLSRYSSGPVSPLSRCSACNTILTSISKKDALDSVPPFIYRKFSTFLHCGTCGRVYWTGSHVRRMKLGERMKGRRSDRKSSG